jgi:hypothetical protein
MRRCPHCQAPNPERALFCQRCGLALPPVAKRPFLALSDLWAPPAAKALLLPLLLILCFRFRFGDWLSVGLQREEWHFIAFHTLHGLLLGAALAWARGERGARAWLGWLLAGLLGGLLAEGLEFWFTYRHVMVGAAYDILAWFEGPQAGVLPYQILQGLRLGGALLPLGLYWAWAQKPSLGLQLLAFLALILAVYARAHVLGFALAWPALSSWLGWHNTLLYAFSVALILYVWGRRPETNP